MVDDVGEGQVVVHDHLIGDGAAEFLGKTKSREEDPHAAWKVLISGGWFTGTGSRSLALGRDVRGQRVVAQEQRGRFEHWQLTRSGRRRSTPEVEPARAQRSGWRHSEEGESCGENKKPGRKAGLVVGDTGFEPADLRDQANARSSVNSGGGEIQTPGSQRPSDRRRGPAEMSVSGKPWVRCRKPRPRVACNPHSIAD